MTKRNSMEVLTAVTAFWIVSITMVFVNKHLLDTSATKFNVLLFVSWFQCASAVFLCFAMSHAGRYFQRPAFVSLDVREMRAVGMLSFVLLFMIVTNNLCLKNVTVAFYYVSRSLSTLFTVLLSYFMLGRVSGWRSMICCGAIVVGYGMGVFEEGSVSTITRSGIIWGVVSSAAAALYCVVMDMTMQSLGRTNVNGEPREVSPSDVRWRITLNTNLNVTLFAAPLVLTSGSPKELCDVLMEQTSFFWFVLILSGLLAVGVTYVTSWQIQVTSAMTHNVSGTAKNCVQTVLGCLIYGDVRSFIWWTSNMVVAAGSVSYAFARQYESVQEKSAASQEASLSQSATLQQVVAHNVGSNKSSRHGSPIRA